MYQSDGRSFHNSVDDGSGIWRFFESKLKLISVSYPSHPWETFLFEIQAAHFMVM